MNKEERSTVGVPVPVRPDRIQSGWSAGNAAEFAFWSMVVGVLASGRHCVSGVQAESTKTDSQNVNM